MPGTPRPTPRDSSAASEGFKGQHTIHGEGSKAARAAHATASAELCQLEDALHVLGMTSAPRTRGRKPAGYSTVRTLADIQWLVRLHHV